MTKPVKKFSVGTIQVAVWDNASKDGQQFYNISMERSYKDKKDEWQKTNTLRASDVPKATLALNKAYEFIVLKDDDIKMTDIL